MPEYDPQAIQRAAVNVIETPYPTLDRARLYVEGPCVLDPSAFGLIASRWVADQYETSRMSMVQDLEGGLARLEDMARGLDQTAVEAAGVDAASAADLELLDTAVESKDMQRGALEGAGAAATTVLALKTAGAVGAGVTPAGAILASSGSGIMASRIGNLMLLNAMRPLHTSILGVLRTSGSMAATAAVAAGIWMMCNPNDSSVNTAIDGWGKASSDINRVKGELESALTPLEQNWNAEDYEAFRVWVGKYQDGLTAAAEFADANADNLTNIVDELNQLQRACFYVAMANLMLIIALTILEKVPYIGQVMTAKKYALGISIVVQTIAGATSWAAIVNKALSALGNVRTDATGGWSDLEVLNVGGVDPESPGFEGLPEADWESPVNQ